ncbi:MAG TPA: peptidoglycan-binding protein [Actinomycetota bacterium]|nr:peptidoglycan-binding protein [Actinomycetota bacterium]
MSPSLGEYPKAPTVSRTSASTRGWGSGWPTCQQDRLVSLSREDGLRLPVNEAIAQLVAMLIDETERRGYDVKTGQSWGFACRAIRGTSVPSNHSWGLAVDINAPSNPYREAFVSDMPTWLPGLWWGYGFFWGGWYQSIKDPMHYEFLGTPADARAMTAKAKSELDRGKPVPYPFYGEGSDRVRAAQEQLALLGFDPGPMDGEYGPKTRAAVEAFERSRPGLQSQADGYFGPLTWRLLFKAEPVEPVEPIEPVEPAEPVEPSGGWDW